MDSWVFILWVIIRYYLLLLLKLFQLQLPRAVFSRLPCPLWHILIIMAFCFWSTSFIFWHYNTLYAHPVHFLPQSQNWLFLQEPWFLSLENGVKTKTWVLGVLIAPGMSLLISLLSWQRKEICVCVPTYVYIFLQILLYVTTCICNKLTLSSYWCLQL